MERAYIVKMTNTENSLGSTMSLHTKTPSMAIWIVMIQSEFYCIIRSNIIAQPEDWNPVESQKQKQVTYSPTKIN